MAQVRWTPTADETLAEIYEFIAVEKQNPDAADRLVQEIHRKSELYAGNPELGDRRHELGPRLRCFPVGNYVVFYRPITDGIVLLFVTHGARDIPKFARQLFRDSPEEIT